MSLPTRHGRWPRAVGPCLHAMCMDFYVCSLTTCVGHLQCGHVSGFRPGMDSGYILWHCLSASDSVHRLCGSSPIGSSGHGHWTVALASCVHQCHCFCVICTRHHFQLFTVVLSVVPPVLGGCSSLHALKYYQTYPVCMTGVFGTNEGTQIC